MKKKAALLILGLVFGLVATAADIDNFCEQVEEGINTLAPWAKATCILTNGGKSGVYSPMLVAAAPVLASEKSKKAFLLVSCAAVGSQMNSNPKLRLNELWITDSDLGKKQAALATQASTCKQLQAEMHSGRTTPDAAYGRLQGSLVRREVTKSR